MNAQTASLDKPTTNQVAVLCTAFLILLLGTLALKPAQSAENKNAVKSNISIGFVNNTYHYDRKHEYRESGHQGVAITWNELSMGTFITSDLDREDRAWFVSKSEPLTEHLSFIYGGAIGYNDIPIVPILGLSAKLAFFRVTLTPTVALFHIEIPIWAD